LKEYFFSKDEVELLNSIGNQIAIAIGRSKSYKELTKKNKYEEIISNITRNVHQSIDLQTVLKYAADSLVDNIDNVDNVSIFLVEGDKAVIKANKGFPKWFIKKIRSIPYPVGLTWHTIINGNSRFCLDVDNDKIIGPAGRKVGIKSYFSVPFQYQGKIIGCIHFNSRQKNAFDQDEMNFLEIVASQI
jgi:GAF domain-containing protein